MRGGERGSRGEEGRRGQRRARDQAAGSKGLAGSRDRNPRRTEDGWGGAGEGAGERAERTQVGDGEGCSTQMGPGYGSGASG